MFRPTEHIFIPINKNNNKINPSAYLSLSFFLFSLTIRDLKDQDLRKTNKLNT